MERLGLPSLVQGYNGKPMLVTKSGTLTHRQHEDGYGLLEMDCNVHYFGFPGPRNLIFEVPGAQEPKFSGPWGSGT